MRIKTMHISRILPTFIAQMGLILVLSSCGSNGTANPAVTLEAGVSVTNMPPAPEIQAIPSEGVVPTIPPPTPTAGSLIQPTSRGPNLEATDPATVALASGQLQLVEFFRFT